MATTTALAPVSSRSTTFLVAPQLINTRRDLTDIFFRFVNEKVKDVAKSFGYTIFWVGQAIPSLPAPVRSFGEMMGNFKNFVSATEIPEKGYKVMSKAQEFFAAPGLQTGRNVFKETTSLINSVSDSIELSTKFVEIKSETMNWVRGINFAATLGGSLNSAIEQVQKMAGLERDQTQAQTLHMINIARDASYIALGVIGLYGIVTATVIAPWLFIGTVTSGLAFTIAGYFYERIVDPENKHADPAKVIQNMQAQNAHLTRGA